MRITTWLLCVASASLVTAGHNTPPPDTLPQNVTNTVGVLYPRESETREVRSLDGIWRFAAAPEDSRGLREKWYSHRLDDVANTRAMPVPSSYNDVTADETLSEYEGIVWYERNFFVPAAWETGQRTWLRFGSVYYKAVVYINGVEAFSHEIGYLPFEAEISSFVKFGESNRLTVLCDNVLSEITVPQSNADNFFVYAGIHRSVYLYTTPILYIKDISVQTNLTEDGAGHVDYKVKIRNNDTECDNSAYVVLQLLDKEGNVVVEEKSSDPTDCKFKGKLVVPEVKPWWPYLMHPEPAYLYQLQIKLHAAGDELLDVYRLKVGIRSLSWDNTDLFLNGQTVYLRGFGKNEESNIRGKGLDLALLTRDFSLLKWVGANSYRTANYPYSEESMQLADEHGIMVIDECSSVAVSYYHPELLQNHMSALEQLIHRDRNHVSVIAWSIANEPRTKGAAAKDYFHKLTTFVRQKPYGRPITMAMIYQIDQDETPSYLDIVGFNQYNGWYENPGELNTIRDSVFQQVRSWNFKNYKKPIIMFEYGADTMEGFHALPSSIWSEEYQSELLSQHFQAFDIVRKKTWLIGEFVWNFADFKTAHTLLGTGGDKKGVFTRNRQPKAAAHVLRQRYYALAQKLNNFSLPLDLNVYIVD